MKKSVTRIVALALAIMLVLSLGLQVMAGGVAVGTTTKSYRGTGHRRYLYQKEVVTSCSVVYDRRSKYITNVWANTNNYGISSSMSKTVSAQGSISQKLIKLGLSGSVSISEGVSTSIPVDSGKMSKLALRADFYKVEYTKYTYSGAGGLKKTEKCTMYTPIPGTAEYYIIYK